MSVYTVFIPQNLPAITVVHSCLHTCFRRLLRYDAPAPALAPARVVQSIAFVCTAAQPYYPDLRFEMSVFVCLSSSLWKFPPMHLSISDLLPLRSSAQALLLLAVAYPCPRAPFVASPGTAQSVRDQARSLEVHKPTIAPSRLASCPPGAVSDANARSTSRRAPPMIPMIIAFSVLLFNLSRAWRGFKLFEA